MKNIYDYAVECLEEKLSFENSEKFVIHRYEGKADELEDFIDLLEVAADFENLDWTIYTDKKDPYYWYVEVWNKGRNWNYAENIRRQVDPEVNYIGKRKEIFDLVDDLWLKVDPQEMISKLRELEK